MVGSLSHDLRILDRMLRPVLVDKLLCGPIPASGGGSRLSALNPSLCWRLNGFSGVAYTEKAHPFPWYKSPKVIALVISRNWENISISSGRLLSKSDIKEKTLRINTFFRRWQVAGALSLVSCEINFKKTTHSCREGQEPILSSKKHAFFVFRSGFCFPLLVSMLLEQKQGSDGRFMAHGASQARWKQRQRAQNWEPERVAECRFPAIRRIFSRTIPSQPNRLLWCLVAFGGP